jgi:hypothetical protein
MQPLLDSEVVYCRNWNNSSDTVQTSSTVVGGKRGRPDDDASRNYHAENITVRHPFFPPLFSLNVLDNLGTCFNYNLFLHWQLEIFAKVASNEFRAKCIKHINLVRTQMERDAAAMVEKIMQRVRTELLRRSSIPIITQATNQDTCCK